MPTYSAGETMIDVSAGDLMELERELVSKIDKFCDDEGVALELSRLVSEKLQLMRGVLENGE